MTFKRRNGASWADVTVAIKRRSGTSWANVQTIKRRSGSAWITVWEAYTSPVLSGSGAYSHNLQARRPADTVTWTPGWTLSGGDAMTYSWVRLSGSTQPAISATTVLNPTFTATGPVLPTKFMGTGEYTYTTATWRLTASDGRTTLTKDYVITLGFEETEMI